MYVCMYVCEVFVCTASDMALQWKQQEAAGGVVG